VYFIDFAIGSSSDSCGKSSATASRPGLTRQPAAATADSWMNLRRAILLNGLSLIDGVRRQSGDSNRKTYESARILAELPERQHNGLCVCATGFLRTILINCCRPRYPATRSDPSTASNTLARPPAAISHRRVLPRIARILHTQNATRIAIGQSDTAIPCRVFCDAAGVPRREHHERFRFEEAKPCHERQPCCW